MLNKKLTSALLILGAPMLFGSGVAAAADGAALYKQKTCVACHGPNGSKPILPTYPKLAGQNAEYLLAQATDIKNGVRANGNAAAMKGVMHLVNEQELTTITKWLSTLK